MPKARKKARPKTTQFDSSEYLDSPEAAAEYLTAALETGDASFIATSIGDVARARGMTEIARQAGLSRENLYRSLGGDSKAEFDTIMRVLTALGVKLSARTKVA
jgi:probable addiction module antidote protein